MNGCILCHYTLDTFLKNNFEQRFHITSEDNSIDTETLVLMIHFQEISRLALSSRFSNMDVLNKKTIICVWREFYFSVAKTLQIAMKIQG